MTTDILGHIEKKIINLMEYKLLLVLILSLLILTLFLNKLGVGYLSFLTMRLNDSAAYISMARAISDSGHFISNLIYPCLITTPYSRFYMPGYYIVLATAYRLLGASIYTFILPSVVSYIISGALIYTIGHKLYNKNAGMIAALIFLLNPLVLLMSLTAMSELTIIAVALSAFYLFLITPPRLKYFVFPVLIALIYLFRQTTVLIAIPMLALIIQTADESGKNKWLWVIDIFGTILLLFAINKWQIHEGLRPFISQNIFSTSLILNGYSAGSLMSNPGSIHGLAKFVLLNIKNFGHNLVLLKSSVMGFDVYSPTENYFILLMVSSICYL